MSCSSRWTFTLQQHLFLTSMWEILSDLLIYVQSPSIMSSKSHHILVSGWLLILLIVLIVTVVLYSGVLVTSFVLIPFAYFFYEAYDPEGTLPKRFFDAFKVRFRNKNHSTLIELFINSLMFSLWFQYTVGFLLLVIILFIVGLFLKPGEKPNGGDPFWVWADKLLGSENRNFFSIITYHYLHF